MERATTSTNYVRALNPFKAKIKTITTTTHSQVSTIFMAVNKEVLKRREVQERQVPNMIEAKRKSHNRNLRLHLRSTLQRTRLGMVVIRRQKMAEMAEFKIVRTQKRVKSWVALQLLQQRSQRKTLKRLRRN